MDEYLKTLLEQIRCKKARPYIRQELQNHMEDQIEANIHAGMNYESAEKEAVKDMGDPIETGISLDRIHKPQIAWKFLLMITLISTAGILIHTMIARHINGNDISTSNEYIIHGGNCCYDGFILFGLYIISKIFKGNCGHIVSDVFTDLVIWKHGKWNELFLVFRTKYIRTGIHAVLCSNLWRSHL